MRNELVQHGGQDALAGGVQAGWWTVGLVLARRRIESRIANEGVSIAALEEDAPEAAEARAEAALVDEAANRDGFVWVVPITR